VTTKEWPNPNWRNRTGSPKASESLYQQICPFATTIFESRYFHVADQNTRPNAIAYPKRNNSLQSDEMNDKRFDIDIDVNVWDITRHVTESISFNLLNDTANKRYIYIFS
jgi:hypothetical protein